MIDAWFSWSLTTMSSFPSSVCTADAFALYALVKHTAASVPLNSAIRFSSSTCSACVPDSVRYPVPSPYWSIASCAAFLRRGSSAKPR